MALESLKKFPFSWRSEVAKTVNEMPVKSLDYRLQAVPTFLLSSLSREKGIGNTGVR